MKSTLVSVLMPAYNTEPFISESIQSILAQTYPHFELLISDDASTDQTFGIAQGYSLKDPRIRVYRQERNLGFVGNKNFLLSKAGGEFIAWQDSDDISFPDRIMQQMQAAQKFQVEMVATDLCRIRKTGGSWAREEKWGSGAESGLIESPVQGYPFMFATLLFSRHVMETTGLFNVYFNGILGEDHHWTMRANSKFKLYFLNQILYGYRVNPGSVTNTFDIRKLIMPEILKVLSAQFSEKGTDWLEENDHNNIKLLESRLLNDKRLMSEQYRIWAAKAIDDRNLPQARKFLLGAFKMNPLNLSHVRTLLYYLRMKFN